MTNSWQELRASNRELALLLLFVPAQKRDICADLILLGFELDNAIHIPSEVMLAAIRLQWWRDALSSPADSKVPLVKRLQSHIAADHFAREDVLALLDEWQDRLGDTDINPQHCWGRCWMLMAAVIKGHDFVAADAAKATAAIGQNCMTLLKAPERRLDPVTLPETANLPRVFAIAAALIRHWCANPTTDQDDPLLVWRMVGWWLGFTPR